METLAFPMLVTVQRNNTGVIRVSMELLRLRLPSNDGLQPNTSHYLGNISAECYDGNEYTRNNKLLPGLFDFSAVRVVSKKFEDWISPEHSLSLLFISLFIAFSEDFIGVLWTVLVWLRIDTTGELL
jgi:hypothetical protein